MSPLDPFVQSIERTASAQLDALRGNTVLVAVSGGADSITLLHVLLELSSRLSLTVRAAHLDHGLRDDSAEQADELERHIGSLGLTLTRGSVDVRAVARRERMSIEAAARKARYEFLATVARELIAAVAVGHNQNDQAETVLLNLARGAGPAGVTGMQPVAPLPGAPDLKLVRPLLGAPATEIRDYCLRQALPILEDPSNTSDDYARNRVRQQVIPPLESVNRRAVAHLAATAEALRADNQALEQLADREYGTVAREQERAVALHVAALAELPPALLTRVLRRALLHAAGTLEGVGARHLAALSELVCAGRDGRAADLPNGVRALTGGGRLLLWAGDLPTAALYPLPLLAHGPSVVTEHRLERPWRWAADTHAGDCGHGYASGGLHEHVRDARGVFELRPPVRGERFVPLGMPHDKGLHEFLSDSRVPHIVRPRVPIVSREGDVVWVMGLRIDDRWRLTGQNDPFVCLRAWRSES